MNSIRTLAVFLPDHCPHALVCVLVVDIVSVDIYPGHLKYPGSAGTEVLAVAVVAQSKSKLDVGFAVIGAMGCSGHD